MEVTIADVAAVLKCSHEPPKLDVPWIDCPSLLTLVDIISDMCEGQYVEKHRHLAGDKIVHYVCIPRCGIVNNVHQLLIRKGLKNGVVSSVKSMVNLGK
jgi:hypothetical protein